MKKVLIVVAVLVAGLVAYVMKRPSTFHIERSVVVAAPPQFVFAQVNDFHNWAHWSPWDKMDPTMKKTYGGEPGAGSTYSWVGNDKVGEGKMTITDSVPNEKVVLKVEFLKPFAATNVVTLSFKPAADSTQTTWAMDGNSEGFFMKAFMAFGDMDGTLGKDFEQGLADLKLAAEADAKQAAPAPEAAPDAGAP